MGWIKVSSEVHNDIKQYLLDIEGMSQGDLVEAAFSYAMEHLEDFEKFLDLEETEENGEDKEDNEDEENADEEQD